MNVAIELILRRKSRQYARKFLATKRYFISFDSGTEVLGSVWGYCRNRCYIKYSTHGAGENQLLANSPHPVGCAIWREVPQNTSEMARTGGTSRSGLRTEPLFRIAIV